MSGKPRYVFDTNTLVSALLFDRSLPALALIAATDSGDLLVSAETIAELSEVLKRPKFDRYLDVEDRERFLVVLVRIGIRVELDGQLAACRDPRDDKFLALALRGRAECVVSGDQDLLVLHPFQGIAIRTPLQFLQSIAHHHEDETAT